MNLLQGVNSSIMFYLHERPTTSIQGPNCPPGATLDSHKCRCDVVTESTCPSGYVPICSDGLCSCERKTQPKWRPAVTNPPSCTAEPYCPHGADLCDCKCVKECSRQCSSGTLSSDRCECRASCTPTCSNGYYLNKTLCTCQPSENDYIFVKLSSFITLYNYSSFKIMAFVFVKYTEKYTVKISGSF